MPVDFSRRALTPELMDGPDVDRDTFRGCLVDLAKVNRLTLAYRPTVAFLNRLHASGLWPRDRPAVILDVGSGYGDMLRLVARWARARNLEVRLVGLDRNPFAGQVAERVKGSQGIQWLAEDLFQHKGGADIVLSSLFTHHLDDEALTRFLEWQEVNARIGWFINDLLRNPVSYYGCAALSRLMLWHPFVRHDGPVSISRAFHPSDWTVRLAEAGVRGARIEPWFPFRLCVSRVRG